MLARLFKVIFAKNKKRMKKKKMTKNCNTPSETTVVIKTYNKERCQKGVARLAMHVWLDSVR